MEKLVCFTRREDGVQTYFNCYFPTEITVDIAEKELCRLGKLLRRLGRKKRGFEWQTTVKASSGEFEFVVRGTKKPSLSFEYSMPHPHFEAVSDCESVYEDISFEGVEQFGEALTSLDVGKSAVLYEVAPPPPSPFEKEYKKANK